MCIIFEYIHQWMVFKVQRAWLKNREKRVFSSYFGFCAWKRNQCWQVFSIVKSAKLNVAFGSIRLEQECDYFHCCKSKTIKPRFWLSCICWNYFMCIEQHFWASVDLNLWHLSICLPSEVIKTFECVAKFSVAGFVKLCKRSEPSQQSPRNSQFIGLLQANGW